LREFLKGKKTMPPRETDRSSDAHSNHTDKRTAPNCLDLIRLISSQQSKEALSVTSNAQDKGKRPAPQEESERPVCEDGKPLEKLQLDPEREFLLGGMQGDSTSRRIRAEDLARMSPSEQVDWCVRGGIVEAFGSSDDRTIVSAVMDMLRNRQIGLIMRCSILKSLGL
jgi:hypothetical protein